MAPSLILPGHVGVAEAGRWSLAATRIALAARRGGLRHLGPAGDE
jgi:hypothetical protein